MDAFVTFGEEKGKKLGSLEDRWVLIQMLAVIPTRLPGQLFIFFWGLLAFTVCSVEF